ncbi:VTT domain-containing protein [Candidatus Bathyarchaeota archaeon]|nr:VTT domain-containing protein [Candidatus Bathyarchaeota archaeon]MBS7630144.1 VTT domain-containing protein [Candidatus Bathyarchaeota archaeon]
MIWLRFVVLNFFDDLWLWVDLFARDYGYAGAFCISVLGNLSIFFPIPYALVIYTLGALLDPILLGIVSGLGSAIGEFSSYFVGRGGRKLLDKRYGKRLDNVRLLIQRFGVITIFAFALLPIPDDLVMIPLGMLKYSLKKAFVAMFAGKTLMCIILAYAGRYSISLIRDLFEAGSIWTVLASIGLLILLIILMLKIDWSRFIPKK